MSSRAHLGAGLLVSVLVGCGSSGAGGGFADGGSGFGGSGGSAGGGAMGGQAGTAGSSGGAAGAAGHTVSGAVAFVNVDAAASTTVILADAAFQPAVPSGAPPGGLEAVDVKGQWAIPGVPNGNYLVLVAYENDGLVLDPDAAVGSSFPTVDVAGSDAVVAATAKVTAALELVGPEGNGILASGLTFAWKSQSSAEYYEVDLFDQGGKLVWQAQVPDSTGALEVSLPYSGPALSSGAEYQFRVSAFTSSAAQITRSEDLRGVFTIAP